MIKQIKNYKIIKLIGKGTFGEVYKVSKDNKYYALKIYQIKNDDTSSSNEYKESIKSIENEIKILSQLDNPFIVKLYEVFSLNPNSELLKNNDVEEQQMMCLVLELCENGDLNDKIKEKKQKNEFFSENEILQYFYEILQGLYYLHKNRVIHRDLKTLNIFLTENNHIKIGDFGVSKKLINNNIYAYTFVGTPYYLSPEICQNKPYDEKSDVWSLGVVLYELITLNKPFDSESQMGLFMKILKGKPAPINNTIKHSYSQKLINLVLENLLDKDPLTRYSIQQTINSGIFNKFFREKEIKYKLSKKRKEQKHSINNTINNNNYQINQSKKNTNRNKALTNQNNNLIKSNVITDSKRIRTNPLKGNIKSNTLSRRAQIAKIPGQNQEKKISLHEKHLQINNKYLNTYKEKISKGEPRITASKYLHQILLNDDEENLNNESNIIKNNINNNDLNSIDDKNKEKNKLIYKPQFMMMNANIQDNSPFELTNNNNREEINNNRYIELDESNTHSILTELLQDPDYIEDSKDEKEEIPIIENFEDVANDKIEIKEIKNKEKTLEELQSEANDKFGKEIVDEILNKYDEYQNDMNFDQTKELDELIFKKMKEDKKKYIDFLEIFYKIIYIKCAQQVENTK